MTPAIARAVAAERRRIRKALRAEWGKWFDRSCGTGGWQDTAGALRGMQAIDEALEAVRPERRGKRP